MRHATCTVQRENLIYRYLYQTHEWFSTELNDAKVVNSTFTNTFAVLAYMRMFELALLPTVYKIFKKNGDSTLVNATLDVAPASTDSLTCRVRSAIIGILSPIHTRTIVVDGPPASLALLPPAMIRLAYLCVNWRLSSRLCLRTSVTKYLKYRGTTLYI